MPSFVPLALLFYYITSLTFLLNVSSRRGAVHNSIFYIGSTDSLLDDIITNTGINVIDSCALNKASLNSIVLVYVNKSVGTNLS